MLQVLELLYYVFRVYSLFWNDFVLKARKSASHAYKLWHQWNKPKYGPLFDLVQRTRALYKYTVRFCRKHEQQVEADENANFLAQKNYNSFWKGVFRSTTPDSVFTYKVGSAEGPTDVCSLWLDHYKTLFNSVSYDRTQMEKLVNSVAHTNNEAVEHVSSRNISTASDAMLNNKAGDCYGLRTEHYKLAGNLYYSGLALCINAMLTHGYIPVDAIYTIICPTVKDKKGDLSSISNYRPIALATIFSKILEHVILDRIYKHLDSS